MLTLTAHIDEHGKLKSPRIAEINAFCNRYKGKTIELTLKIKRKRRSDLQNGYYFGVVVEMIRDAMNELGNEWDSDTTHEALKAKFNTKEVVNKAGISDTVPFSTTELNTSEFEAYLERIRVWAAQFLSINIPLPNSQSELILITPETNNNTSFLIAEKKRV